MPSAFQAQLMSLVAEGAFDRFPTCGCCAPRAASPGCRAFMWRFDRLWRGLRREIPWTRRPPSAYMREHVRLTTQPFDAPVGRSSRACSTRSARTRCSALRPTTRTGSPRPSPPRVPPLRRRAGAAGDPGRQRAPALSASEVSTMASEQRQIYRPPDRLRRPQRAAGRRRAAPLPAGGLARRGATRLTYLPTAFREVRENLGDRSYIGAEYPRPTPRASRVDAWPPGGGAAGLRPRLHAGSSCSTRGTSSTRCSTRCSGSARC